MKKIKNKGLLIGLIVFFIILILGIILFPKFKSGFTGPTTTVYQLKDNIPGKTQINEEIIKEIEFPSEYIVDKKGLVTSKEELINSYSKFPISKNDIITKDKITNKDDKALFSKGNLLAVTVSSLSSSVAGKIYPEDFVKVYAYVKQEKQGPDGEIINTSTVIAPKELEKVEVAYILTAQAKDTTDDEENKNQQLVPNVVVFKIADEKQANALVKLEYEGKIHLEKLN